MAIPGVRESDFNPTGVTAKIARGQYHPEPVTPDDLKEERDIVPGIKGLEEDCEDDDEDE